MAERTAWKHESVAGLRHSNIRQALQDSAKNRTVERISRATRLEIDLDTFKRKSWPGVTAEFVRFSPPSEHEFRLNRPSDTLMLLDIRRTDGETTIPGAVRSTRKDLRNRMTFVPSGTVLKGWAKITAPASTTAVYFDRQALRRCSHRELPPLIEFEDNMLQAAMLQFRSLLHDPTLEQPGYAETLGILLAYELGRLGDRNRGPLHIQGGLTPRQLRTVTDYMEGHLAEPPSISQIAGLLNLSRYHFIRAFKKAVGQTPYQYIVRRRIERARELLREERLSVTEVASHCGFSSNAHLTRTFRQVVGTTPSAYRRGI